MKLKSMQVKNFKCLEDSTRFDICPVTCLVGKNEAGKTSLLEALHKLNPDVAELGEFDVLLEYPRRRRKEYQRRAAHWSCQVLPRRVFAPPAKNAGRSTGGKTVAPHR